MTRSFMASCTNLYLGSLGIAGTVGSLYGALVTDDNVVRYTLVVSSILFLKLTWETLLRMKWFTSGSTRTD